MQQKRVAGRSFFQKLGFQGPGCISLAGSQGQRPQTVFHVDLRLNRSFFVQLNYHKKTSVWHLTIKSYLSHCKVCFYQHCFAKVIETYCCDGKSKQTMLS